MTQVCPPAFRATISCTKRPAARTGSKWGGKYGSVEGGDIPAAVRAAHDPVVIGDAGEQTTVEARIDPARFVPDNIERAWIRLTVARLGRIVRLDVMTRSEGERSLMTMEFAHWNLELTIPAPEGADRQPSRPPTSAV